MGTHLIRRGRYDSLAKIREMAARGARGCAVAEELGTCCSTTSCDCSVGCLALSTALDLVSLNGSMTAPRILPQAVEGQVDSMPGAAGGDSEGASG